MSDVLNSTDLARQLGVTPSTVLAWARRGWIPCLRAGRRPVLFDVAAVKQAMAERANRQEVARAR
jgi:excisionase family DNA binding protein